MARMVSEIDWMQCELIEQIPGKVSGRPIVRGTRILPDAIINSYDVGEPLDLIHENYPGLSIPQIQRLIEFAHAWRGQQGRAKPVSEIPFHSRKFPAGASAPGPFSFAANAGAAVRRSQFQSSRYQR
jgi:uncharacterized protein (DUF433 family)